MEGLGRFSNPKQDTVVSNSAIQPELYLVEEEQLSWGSGPPAHGGRLLTHGCTHFRLSSALPASYLASVRLGFGQPNT